MNYVELAIPFFVLAVALEFAYGRLTGRQTYRLSDTINSLQLGVLSRLVDLLKLGFSAAVLGSLAELAGLPQWSMTAVWQWLLVFVAYDFCYYWKHRFGHECRIFWASHVAHHQSEEFNLSTALRQTGTDYLGFVFYIPLFLVGIPASAVITVGSLNLIYQFWVHTEHIRRLGPLEWLLVTPSNHRVHHARNPCYIDRNYAGVFILWDRWFGTFQDERADEPCVYGVTKGLRSWNPVWANLHVWHETAQQAWRSPRWRDKLLIWFKRPDWTPPGVPKAEAAPVQDEKFDPPVSGFARTYTFMQFWLLTAAALWLMAKHAALPRMTVLALLGWLCFSMYVQGAWLEGRQHALRLEGLRLAIAVLLAVMAYLSAIATVPGVLAGYAVLSAIVLSVTQMWSVGQRSILDDRNPTAAS